MANYEMAPDANKEGVQLRPEVLALLSKVGELSGSPLTVKLGTNHPAQTPAGYLSDHAGGRAVDLEPTSEAEGDKIAAAALQVAGVPAQKAMPMARAGGLWTVPHQGFQVQVAWKTYEGGDHHLCIHIGFESDAATPSQAVPVGAVTRRRTGVPPEEAAVVDMRGPGAYPRPERAA